MRLSDSLSKLHSTPIITGVIKIAIMIMCTLCVRVALICCYHLDCIADIKRKMTCEETASKNIRHLPPVV